MIDATTLAPATHRSKSDGILHATTHNPQINHWKYHMQKALPVRWVKVLLFSFETAKGYKQLSKGKLRQPSKEHPDRKSTANRPGHKNDLDATNADRALI